MKHNKENIDTEDIEINLLLQALHLKYGYDFRNYSKAHLNRRINQRVRLSGLSTITELQNKVLWDKEFFRLFSSGSLH